AIGILAGVVCLVLGELKGSRRYAWTADALDAAGIALLYVVFFAAFARWHLVGSTVAFVLFVMATVVAVLLSIRRASLLIALLGLVGGFASPAIVATGQDNPIGLFGYLLLLNAGLAWVAYKRRWPLLTAISLGITTIYQWGWVSKFLTTGKLPLAAAIFLIFPVMSFVGLSLNRPAADERRSTNVLFANAARIGAVLPLLFSIYLATVPAYGARYGILFGFLFVLDAGLFAVAVFQGPRLLHLLGAVSTLIVFGIWFGGSYDSSAWPWVLLAVAAFTLFYLAAPFISSAKFVRRRAGDLALGELGSRAVLAAPLLLFVFSVLAAIEPRAASPALLFGVLLVLLGACSAYAIVRREGIVHFIAAFFVVAAEAVWSAKHLAPPRLLAAMAIYGVFGLFFIGVPVVARRRGAPLEPQGAGSILALVNRRRIRVAHNGGKHLGHTSSVGISGGRDARHLPQRRVRWPRWASFPALRRRDAGSVYSSGPATRRARRVDGSCWRGRIVRQAWRALSRCDRRRGGSGLRMAIHGTIGTMADGCHRRGRGARRPRRVLAPAGPSRRR
ncbi:MAG: hypothetical protein DMD26_16205, partial [Gemmatimonadetes bacterium]